MAAIRRVFLQIATLLGLYLLLRLLFFGINHQLFLKASSTDLVLACINGLRYDLSAIALINTGIFVIQLIPLNKLSAAVNRGKNFVLGFCFTLVNGFTLSLNVVDLEYFKFTGKRITADGFLLARDIGDQTLQIALYYWYFSILILFIYGILAWVSRRTYRQENRGSVIAAISIAILGGLAFRGGWQAKPLIPANAFAQNPEMGSVVLNTTFTLIKSSDKAAVSELNEMASEEVKAIISQAKVTKPLPLDSSWPKPKNIVVIILESFGSEYVFPPQNKPSYAPFLKELSERGSNFPRAYANARRSIDAMPAIFSGVPTWMEPPFITSPYQTNQIAAAPQVFLENGYETLFFHGGNNGTMFFDVMAKRLGFAGYYGADQYPDRKDYDGKWGIFDEPYLQYFADTLGKQEKPFLATVFTLSSHHPYTIPPQHKDKFPKGTLEIHESVAYADFALRRFYETAKSMPWFQDTLFVITADHTSKQEYPENDNLEGRFHVPLVLIMNDKPLPFPDSVLASPVQHADLSETLLDIARLSQAKASHFGESLCRLEKRPGVVMYEFDGYHLIGMHSGLSWWRDGRSETFHLFNPAQDTEVPESGREFLPYVKANAHYYNNGMVRNQLIW